MASTEVQKASVPARLSGFVQDVVAEMKKVTWPDRTQVRSLSLMVLIFSLVVGAVIGLMDLVLQGVIVRLLPSLLGR